MPNAKNTDARAAKDAAKANKGKTIRRDTGLPKMKPKSAPRQVKITR